MAGSDLQLDRPISNVAPTIKDRHYRLNNSLKDKIGRYGSVVPLPDVTEQIMAQASQRQLEETQRLETQRDLSFKDPLTCAYNRRYLFEVGEEAVLKARKNPVRYYVRLSPL